MALYTGKAILLTFKPMPLVQNMIGAVVGLMASQPICEMVLKPGEIKTVVLLTKDGDSQEWVSEVLRHLVEPFSVAGSISTDLIDWPKK